MTELDKAIDRWRQADHVLITAGAGLSGAAGYDYTDETAFAAIFPELTKFGFRNRVEFINPALPDEVLWGFWARHLDNIRFDPAPNPLYQRLRSVVAEQDTWVMTSNVDQLFARNGFDPARIFTPQGDYGYYQCYLPCTREVWDSRPLVDRLLAEIDPGTGAVPIAAVPVCPRCGGRTFLNVNIGHRYIDDHYLPHLDRLNEWLSTTAAGSLVVVEFGAGYNTPAVIRSPGERLVAAHPDGVLIRVNPRHSAVPSRLGERGIAIPVDANEFLAAVPDPMG